MQKTWVQSLDQEDPLEKEMATTVVFLPGEAYGQRSLASYSPWDYKESDVTEQTNTSTFTFLPTASCQVTVQVSSSFYSHPHDFVSTFSGSICNQVPGPALH